MALFVVRVENFEAVQTTDSTLEIRCSVDSNFGFSLENAKVQLTFSGDPSTSVAQEPNLSVLSLQHEKKDNVCRLVSELKLKSQQQSEKNDAQKFLIQTEAMTIIPGGNQIVLRADIKKIGCFVLEKVSVITDFLFYDTSSVITRRPAVLYCIPTPHSVSVVNDSQRKILKLLTVIREFFQISLPASCKI